MTWSEHPFPPHWTLKHGRATMARCCRSACRAGLFVVTLPGRRRPVTYGDTAQEAMARYDAMRAAEVGRQVGG